jgi:hypothetical protein
MEASPIRSSLLACLGVHRSRRTLLQRSGVLFGGLAGPGDGVVELVVIEVLDLGADEVLGEAGSELGHAMAAARSSFPKTRSGKAGGTP